MESASTLPAGDPDGLREAIAVALAQVRRRTLELVASLDDAALRLQHDPIMSPVVWDLGHIAHFERQWLLGRLGGEADVDPALDRMYDPFSNPRHVRGNLALPARTDALAYLASVRSAVLEALEVETFPEADPLRRRGYVYWMIVQHEPQHLETILQGLDLRAGAAPYPPATPCTRLAAVALDDRERIEVPGGPVSIGTDDRAGAYDNERPRHVETLPPFRIDRYPTTCRRYLEFVEDGGYQRPELWEPAGFSWARERGHRAPQGWSRSNGAGWALERFGHRLALEPGEPVQHISWYEADAFARWAGGRLPSEQEWEAAAALSGAPYPWGEAPIAPSRANLGGSRYAPAPIGAFPGGRSRLGAEQLIGDVYEWTASEFRPYPGYRSFPYPEYSEVFFGSAYKVLRGASWATSPHCARATFRNWDFPVRRQIFAGCRLAWDAG